MTDVIQPPTQASGSGSTSGLDSKPVIQHPTFHSRTHISVGDLVIIFMTRDFLKAIIVTPGEEFHNKFGRYTHDSLIGVKFGTKVHSPPPAAGYIYVLRPTPELWTLSLPHRTQILYTPDIAYITMRLGVRPGGKVAEAGTGSGSMTHGLSRSVGVNGRVLSYEYHEARYGKAKEEFETHGLENVTLSHRNVCKDGFGDVEGVEGVFLDLPAPWEAIPYATKIMRPDILTRICCFSPCLEQVLKTVSTLRTEGFTEISTQEVLVRNHELAQPSPSSSSRLSSVTEIVGRLKDHEKRKEERRVVQMKTAREKSKKQKEAEAAAAAAAAKAIFVPAPIDQGEGDADAGMSGDTKSGEKRSADEVTDEKSVDTKKRRLDEQSQSQSATNPNPNAQRQRDRDQSRLEELQASLEQINTSRDSVDWTEPEPYPSEIVLTKPANEMRGHTSYLTFATLYPLAIRNETAPVERERKSRVDELKESETTVGTPTETGGSDYGSEGIDEALRTMTEEEMIALAGTGAGAGEA